MIKKCFALAVALGVSAPAVADVKPEIFTLDNGMKFILLPRAEEPNSVAVGYVGGAFTFSDFYCNRKLT